MRFSRPQEHEESEEEQAFGIWESSAQDSEEARDLGSRCRLLRLSVLAALLVTALLGLLTGSHSRHFRPARVGGGSDLATEEKAALAADDPMWGCGLVGLIPGISPAGVATPEAQRLIDGMKGSSSFNKATYWNWNLAPQKVESGVEHLTSDFLFMPEMWGAGVVDEKFVRPAGASDFLDSTGKTSPAEMATLFLGMNEPDIRGSCMGNMFGKCMAPCDPASVAAGDCPAAQLDIKLPPATPNAKGQCNCWQFSHATGVGFWPLDGCSGQQPLIKLWQDPACSNVVVDNWKQTAAIAFGKGYKYLSTPLVAVDVGYAQKFIEKACGCTAPGQCACTDASCGCPVYVGFHFYAYDCRPEVGGYKDFMEKLSNVTRIMELYPFVKGAIINEVGMLNCAPNTESPICVPDGGQNPASKVPDHGCPNNGLATFIDKLFDYVISQKTSDGRRVVKAFSWFNENMAGGTYNLRLFTPDGTLNSAGESYIRNCARWGASWRTP
uniref:Asl1-like glycosyl hydrolase catalytic domain-containing protein n=1 Tax=Alexandrium monilatum TaxID=311494 RepID=A0A7S4SM51_9DINO